MPDLNFSSEIVDQDDTDEFELIHLEPGQEIPKEEAAPPENPDEIKLNRADYEALIKGKDSTTTLAQGLQNLGEVLRAPQQPAPANVPPLPAFDADAVEEEAFKPKGFASAVEKVVAARMADMQAGMSQALQAENKARLKIDPATKETYTTYEKEIESRVAALPPQYRFNPTIYEQVHKQVVLEHIDEIAEKRASAMVEQKVAEALAKAGIAPAPDGAAQKKPAPAMYQEGGVRTVTAKPKPKVYFTAADKADYIERGGDLKDQNMIAAYLASKYKEGR